MPNSLEQGYHVTDTFAKHHCKSCSSCSTKGHLCLLSHGKGSILGLARTQHICQKFLPSVSKCTEALCTVQGFVLVLYSR